MNVGDVTDRLTAALIELVAALREEIRDELRTVSTAPDRLLSVDEAAATLGLGRTSVFQELAAGRLRSMSVGRRRLIPAAAISEFIHREAEERDGHRARASS